MQIVMMNNAASPSTAGPRTGSDLTIGTDTMAIEARIRRPATAGLLERLLGRAPPSIRLADSRARYGLPRYRPHHAPTDALASAELLQAQIAHRFSPDTPVCDLWQ